MFLFLNIFALLLMPHKPQIFYSSTWPAFGQGMPAWYLIGVWAHTCVCVYVHTHFSCSSETPKMSNDLESSRVTVGQLKWAYSSENCAYTYMSKCFMYFDSVVVSPFLDPFSFMKFSVCMNCVQVSGRHRLPHDRNNEGVKLFSESPMNMHKVLGVEVWGLLHFLSDGIITLGWNCWVFSGFLRKKCYILNFSSSKPVELLSIVLSAYVYSAK